MKATVAGSPAEAREHGDPRPRLTRDGYTRAGGSPTPLQVKWEGRWRRVYLTQTSNAGTTFIRPFLVVAVSP
jgi:hypothetical protein